MKLAPAGLAAVVALAAILLPAASASAQGSAGPQYEVQIPTVDGKPQKRGQPNRSDSSDGSAGGDAQPTEEPTGTGKKGSPNRGTAKKRTERNGDKPAGKRKNGSATKQNDDDDAKASLAGTSGRGDGGGGGGSVLGGEAWWLVGALALIALGAGGAAYARRRSQAGPSQART